MNKHIIITALCFLFTIEAFAQAGPTNGDSYRSYIRTNGISFGYDHNGDAVSNRPVYVIEGSPQADPNNPTCLFDTITGFDMDNGALSIVHNSPTGPPPFFNGAIRDVVDITSDETIMDLTMMSWDHVCGVTFDYDPSCDFDKEAACIKTDTREGPQGVYHEQWYTIEDSTRINLQKTWKPTFGEDYTSAGGANGPLTFGTIGLNEYRVHENGNRSRPAGSPADMGYKNWYYNGRLGDDPVFTSSPDVTYSFSKTQTSYAIVSLDFPETNFDTRVYVLRDDGSNNGAGRSFGWRTEVNATNGNAVFSWPTLPAGDYFIVVEGEEALERGDFKMTVAFPSTYEPGTITHPNLLVPRGCVLDTDITSGVQPETSLGDLEFQWEYKSREKDPWEDISGAISETLSGEELGAITDSTFVRRRLKSMGGAAYTNTLAFAKQDPDGGNISGRVTGPNGTTGVGDVALIIKSDDNNTCKPDTFYTQPNGTYNTANLFIGSYTVTPMYQNHEFDPPHLDVTINSTNGVEDQNFKDFTTLFVEGKVIQTDMGTTCPLPGVLINTIGRSEEAISLEDGSYRISIEPGLFSFEASFLEEAHTFQPAIYENVMVNTNLTGYDYESTTTHTVSGAVMACGEFCYGGVEIKFVDDYGCFEYTIETDECGYFSADLPARNYQLKITNTDIGLVEGYDAQEIYDFFSNKDTIYADLSSADTMFILAYEQAPVVTLRPHTDSTGIQPIGNCSQDTVLGQRELTTLVFDIVEANTGGCALDTGIMVMIDTISGRDTVYIPISDGVAVYDVIPEKPNLFPYSPYQYLDYYAMNLDSQLVSSSHKIGAIITGLKAGNSSFTTVSPEIPFLILRDPPGDQSSSYFSEAHTTEFNLSFSAEYGGSVTTWGKAKTGAKFEAGALGFSTESNVWGEVGAAATVSARNASDSDLTMSVTNTVEFSTEDDPSIKEVIGEGGDLFVGAAMNLIFAKADILLYDEEVCQDTQIVDVIMGQDSFATQFSYTAHYIRNVEIPKLAALRDIGPPDSIWWYQNQMDMWEQTLARNEELKEMAQISESYPSNISFSGSNTQVYTIEKSTSSTITYEFSLEVEAEFSSEVGFEVAGSGVSGGVQSNFRVEIGGGSSSTELKNRVTRFTLKDSDPEDGYTVDIRECPVYNTPVFNVVGGTSSCPYLPGTVKRDAPLILIDDPVRIDADPDGTETFVLKIYNLNESINPEERTYILDFIDNTNPNNATMSPNLRGSDFLTLLNLPHNPPGSAPHEEIIEISNNNGAFDYENLTFVVYAACDDIASMDPATSSRASVSIFYDSPCSDIEMSSPTNDYNVNSTDDNLIPITLSGYSLGQLDDIEVQYTTSGGANWTTGLVVPGDQLDPVTTIVNLDVSTLSDGAYAIRARLNCAGGASFTQRDTSTIDRIAPIVFGTPSPTDDIYDESANDEISVSFEEDITCVNASVLLTDMETLEVIPATLSCADNQAIVVPDVVLDSRGPAVYRVTLIGVEDLYGNVRDDYRWVFIVGDYIYDPDCSPVNISNNNVDQDAISQSVYRATEITSDGTVASATQIGYVAQDNVSLEQGFTVSEDGTLEISIENCND